MKRRRLDEVLCERHLAGTIQDAFLIVTEGLVFVNGQKAVSPAQPVGTDAGIEVRNRRRYVGRGAEKLEAAMRSFGVDATGKIAVDIGAATGGFTEVLLDHGAKRVYAIDTAIGKLALKIRRDSRVVVMEKTDVRDLAALPEKADLAVADVSLISLTDILPHVRRLLAPKGRAIVLFKPQYETRDPGMLKHGVLYDETLREALVRDFEAWLPGHGWDAEGKMRSPITGSKGNVEYLFLLCLRSSLSS